MFTPAGSQPYREPEPDAAQQAQYLLYYDELTGLYNRRLYNRAYAEHTAYATAAGTSLALAVIDVDFFKSINDRYGHQQGDAILSGVGQTINAVVGTAGMPIRYAGDEFALLLPGVSREDATALASTLSEAIRGREFKLLNVQRHVSVTFSIGVAHFPDDTDDAERLFENADHATYIAKKQGRDRVINYQAGVKYVLDPGTLYHYFPCPTLVARGELVDGLLEALAASMTAGVPWDVLAGHGGVGKTRLLQEFKGRIDRQRRLVLQAAGLPYRTGQPFGILLDALGTHIRENPQDAQRMVAGLSGMEIAAVAKLLPDLSRYALMHPEGGTDENADPYLEAFCKMLVGDGAHPPCIIFDDFQWADQGTMKVLEAVRERDPRAYVCLGIRNDAESVEKNPSVTQFLNRIQASGAARRHDLAAFDRAQCKQMIAAILPDAAAFDDLVSLVFERSRGVPLIVEEVLKFLIHQHCIYYEQGKLIFDDAAREQIPSDSSRLLEARAGQVDDEIRELLSRAAVIGSDFDFSTLLSMESRDEGYVRGIVERARKSHIITLAWSDDSDRISFISTQTHQAFYNALDNEERRKLHLKMARLRQRQYANTIDAALSELAYHFSRGGEADRAQQYLKIISELYGQYASTDVVMVGKTEEVARFLDGEMPEEMLKMAADIVRGLRLGIQNIRMYGSEHVRRKGGFDELQAEIDTLLELTEGVTYTEVDGRMLINGTPLPPHLDYGSGFLENLRNANIKGLTFHRGVAGTEIRALLDFLSLGREDLKGRGGLVSLLQQVGISSIVPNEKVYVAIGERDILVKKNISGQEMLIKQVAEGEDVQMLDGAVTAVRAKGADGLPALDGAARESAEQMQAMLAQLTGGEGAGAAGLESLQRLKEAQAEVAEWRREIARYADKALLDKLSGDWAVPQSDLESGETMKIAAASKIYLDAGDDAIDPLMRVIARTQDERARRFAASLLRKISLDAVERITFALAETQRSLEMLNYIAALEDFDDAAIVGRMEGLVYHRATEIRRAALSSISRRSKGRLEAFLLQALQEQSVDIQVDVIHSLGEQKNVLAFPHLEKLIRPCSWFFFERDARVQAAACQALGRIGDPSALRPLLRAMGRGGFLHRTKPPQVRAAAALALSNLPGAGDDEAVRRAWERAAKDRNAVLRSAARVALEKVD